MALPGLPVLRSSKADSFWISVIIVSDVISGLEADPLVLQRQAKSIATTMASIVLADIRRGVRVARCERRDAGCGMPGIGYWDMGNGYWMLDAGFWIPDAGCRIPDVEYWIPDMTDLVAVMKEGIDSSG